MNVRYRSSVAIAILLAGLAGAIVWYNRASTTPGPAGGGPAGGGAADRRAARQAGFREAALEAGLDFRMEFMPDEQGENFKINLYDHGCGVAVGDYNGDDDDDVYFLNQLGPNALFRNKGNGTFEEDMQAKKTVGLGDRICVGATFADYDNDADQDLYVTSTRGGNVLLRNDAGGFTDVTSQAGLTQVAHSQTAAFFDYDNDGDLDLFVTNSATWTTNEVHKGERYYVGPSQLFDLLGSPREFNVLYRNNGDGTFDDVTADSGLAGRGWGGDVAIFDYDDDGDVDVFITNMFGVSQLMRNDAQGRFTDVTWATLGRTSFGAIGAKAFDYNNDGRLDLFVTDMHSDMWTGYTEAELVEAGKKYGGVSGRLPEIHEGVGAFERAYAEKIDLEPDRVLFGNTLFRGLGKGNFKEVSGPARMETFWPWGVATGDWDNDGYEDAFIPSGMGFPYFYWRNHLMMNQGNGTFADESHHKGIDPPSRGIYLDRKIGDKPAARSSRCAATADFDGDGKLELVVNNFNDTPYYFRNEFPRRHYVALRLRGTRCNRDAVGAVVRLKIGSETLTRQVNCAGGYLSQSSKTLHFGLGKHTRIDGAQVRWPGGAVQTLTELGIDRIHEVVER